jgi:type IV pilus assembly protein PilA
MNQPPPGYGPSGPWPPQGPPNYYAPPGYPPPKKGGGPWAVIGVLAIVAIPVLGVVSALAIYGVRRYLVSAKNVEAKNTVGAIARGAAAAFERDGKLCESAGPVPAKVPSGAKYQSSPSDWTAFSCLRFSMTMPQYYQYSYTPTSNGFVVTARGDLDGDGVFSEITQRATVTNGRVVVEPELVLKDPFE